MKQHVTHVRGSAKTIIVYIQNIYNATIQYPVVPSICFNINVSFKTTHKLTLPLQPCCHEEVKYMVHTSFI